MPSEIFAISWCDRTCHKNALFVRSEILVFMMSYGDALRDFFIKVGIDRKIHKRKRHSESYTKTCLVSEDIKGILLTHFIIFTSGLRFTFSKHHFLNSADIIGASSLTVNLLAVAYHSDTIMVAMLKSKGKWICRERYLC